MEFGLEANAAEEPDSPPVLEYGRRPRAINDEHEDPDTEEEVVPRVEDPGVPVQHAECVAEPAIEESYFWANHWKQI